MGHDCHPAGGLGGEVHEALPQFLNFSSIQKAITAALHNLLAEDLVYDKVKVLFNDGA